MSYQIVGTPPDPKDIRDDFDGFIQKLERMGIARVKMLFGFAWANELYEKDWLELHVTPKQLREKVSVAEKSGAGSLGDDDIFITVEELGYERQYCHHADIHLEAESSNSFAEEQKAEWIARGWQVHESSGS